jgi:hypothetical protein
MKFKNYILLLLAVSSTNVFAQSVPSKSENINYIVTFGKDAPGTWGDDDYTQTFFFAVPETAEEPFYIRVFDPDCGGEHDQINKVFNTKTTFTLYGGEGAFKNKAAINVNPIGDYKSGVELATATFGNDKQYDGQWYSFGPINPKEGEYDGNLKARIFKLITEGVSGDDGNMYRYFLSQSSTENIEILGANAFTYEYTFRLKEEAGTQSYFYPFVDKNTVKIIQHNFDFDNDGAIKVYSAVKNGHYSNYSNDGIWSQGVHNVEKEEQGKSMNVRLIKRGTFQNDMTLYITNEYNIPVPLFATPLGGMPKYVYKVDVKYKTK